MEDFREDRRSGSTDVATAFLDDLGRWAGIDTSISASSFRSALVAHLRAAQAAQPTMALVHQLAARALAVTDGGLVREDPLPALRRTLEESCDAERADLESAQGAAAKQAARLVTESDSWIGTLSASGAVLGALREAQAAGRAPRALIAESRPLCEGRVLAAALAGLGLPAWLVVDAALPLLLSQARMVWLGADAVTERGILNKVGSYAVTLAAREHSVPVYAIAVRRKFLPAGTRALGILEMPPAEVWDEAPKGVEPRNVYFEEVPLPLLRGVVVEDAVLTPGEAAALASQRALPEELSG